MPLHGPAPARVTGSPTAPPRYYRRRDQAVGSNHSCTGGPANCGSASRARLAGRDLPAPQHESTGTVSRGL